MKTGVKTVCLQEVPPRKTLSDGTDVAGTHKYARANFASWDIVHGIEVERWALVLAVLV